MLKDVINPFTSHRAVSREAPDTNTESPPQQSSDPVDINHDEDLWPDRQTPCGLGDMRNSTGPLDASPPDAARGSRRAVEDWRSDGDIDLRSSEDDRDVRRKTDQRKRSRRHSSPRSPYSSRERHQVCELHDNFSIPFTDVETAIHLCELVAC